MRRRKATAGAARDSPILPPPLPCGGHVETASDQTSEVSHKRAATGALEKKIHVASKALAEAVRDSPTSQVAAAEKRDRRRARSAEAADKRYDHRHRGLLLNLLLLLLPLTSATISSSSLCLLGHAGVPRRRSPLSYIRPIAPCAVVMWTPDAARPRSAAAGRSRISRRRILGF